MAIAAPSDEVTRLVEALGLRTKNTREVTLRMAVNEVVAVNTVEYVNAEQAGALAAELKARQYRLVRWIPVEERLPDERVKVLTCGDDPVEGPFTLIGMREPASIFGPAHWHLPPGAHHLTVFG